MVYIQSFGVYEVKDIQLLSICLFFNGSQAKFLLKMQIRLMEACNILLNRFLQM